MRCTILKSRTRSLQMSDLNLTLTLSITLAKSHSAFCKLRTLRNCAQQSIVSCQWSSSKGYVL